MLIPFEIPVDMTALHSVSGSSSGLRRAAHVRPLPPVANGCCNGRYGIDAGHRCENHPNGRFQHLRLRTFEPLRLLTFVISQTDLASEQSFIFKLASQNFTNEFITCIV